VRAEGTPEALVPHKVLGGNRPSSLLLADELTPRTLGSLVALYEHAVFTAATIWGTDPFDQWGVEHGKALAKELVPAVRGEAPADGQDASTRAALAWYLARRR
ncbi:MAG: glucose-6-phosphate isomerase, partial [Actinomycetota bacterium]